MRTPGATLSAAVAADTIKAAWLVELQFSGGTVRLALYPLDLTFETNTFSAGNGQLSEINQNLEGRAPRCRLVLQNLDDAIRDSLKADVNVQVGATDYEARPHQARGTVVILRLVLTDNLAEGAVLEDTYLLDAYTFDGRTARLELASSPILRGIQVPGRRTQTWYCPFEFKSSECGFVGRLGPTDPGYIPISAETLASCDFTYDGPNGCTKHFGKAEAKRFGGFIGRPQIGLAAY
jgi:phage-related protein